MHKLGSYSFANQLNTTASSEVTESVDPLWGRLFERVGPETRLKFDLGDPAVVVSRLRCEVLEPMCSRYRWLRRTAVGPRDGLRRVFH